MASYAGAKAAVRTYFAGLWTTTPVLFKNGSTDRPKGEDGQPLPWLFFEIVGSGSRIYAAGKPGNSVWYYDRLIQLHVFVPKGEGEDRATELADTAGELFRAKVLYDDVTPGCYVRTWAPSTDEDDDGAADEEGVYFRRTCRIPFEYWHRA